MFVCFFHKYLRLFKPARVSNKMIRNLQRSSKLDKLENPTIPGRARLYDFHITEIRWAVKGHEAIDNQLLRIPCSGGF